MEALLTNALATMPAHTRVWVYKSAMPFTPAQQQQLLARGQAFAGAWKSHGEAVPAAFAVLHDHFVVIAADLLGMTICGGAIDGSVQFIKQVETDLGLQLTDRMVVLYQRDGVTNACRVGEVETLLKNGTLGPDTPVFDDLVATKADLETRFRTPLRSTWMARYL